MKNKPIYDRISFIIDKKDIERKVGIEISDDVFYKVIEDGNYMGDELCKYFMDNHLDVRWILQMVKLYERISK